jgi:hypothetical protein
MRETYSRSSDGSRPPTDLGELMDYELTRSWGDVGDTFMADLHARLGPGGADLAESVAVST